MALDEAVFTESSPEFGDPQTTAVLRLEGITKSYGPVVALRDVALEVDAGEVHALVGENGAGKSTLMAVTAAVTQPDIGTITFDGEIVNGTTPDDMRDRGLAVVYQHPALLPDLSIAENLALGVPRAQRPSMRRAVSWARRKLDDNGLALDPRTRVEDLSLANRHLVEITKALASRPKVLVLDEPTEPLTEDQTEALFSQIREATDRGIAVVYISHRLPDVRRISDRVTVLRDGQNQGTFSVGELSEDDILRLIVGRNVDAAFPDKGTVVTDRERLRVEGLSGRGFSAVDLTVRAGEIVGLAGIEGNGQHEFIRALAAVEAPVGTVRVDGRDIELSSPAAAISSGITYIPGDRHTEGLMMPMSVRENMTLMTLLGHARGGIVSRASEAETVAAQQHALAIKMASGEAPVKSLSGGNQQKTLFARALLTEPAVLLADEPTQGVDAGARLDLYRELRAVADAGGAVVILSSDAIELRGLCDRVLVFSRGQVVAELADDDVNEDNITHAAVTSSTIRRHTDTADSLGRRLRRFLSGDYAPALLLAIVALGIGIYTTVRNDRYLSQINFENYFYLAAVLGFVALAQSVVVMTGGIDLSVGPLIGLATVVGSYSLTSGGVGGLLIGILAVFAATGSVGVVNGLLVDRVRITPVIATLVTFFALQGVNLLIRLTPGGRISTRYAGWMRETIWFIPIAFIVLVALVVAVEVALRRTMWGLRLRAVGSDTEVAHRVGVPVPRTVIGAYATCSVIATGAGLLFAALIQVGDPRAGLSYTLSSIAAVVLGGAAVAGGRGSFIGVFAGAMVLQQTSNIDTFLGLDSAWQFWFVGVLTLAAATLYSQVRTRS